MDTVDLAQFTVVLATATMHSITDPYSFIYSFMAQTVVMEPL